MSGIRDRHGAASASRPSLRFPFVLPLLIAAVVLSGLWGYAGYGMTRDALGLRADADRVTSAGEPLQTLIAGLQEERLRTAVWRDTAAEVDRGDMSDARDRTDEAVAGLQAARSAVTDAVGTGPGQLAALTDALEGLADLRASADNGTVDELETARGYTALTSEAGTLFAAAVQGDSGAARGAAATASLMRLTETLSRQEALLRAADGTDDAQSAEGEFAQALAAHADARSAVDVPGLPAAERGRFQQLADGEDWAALETLDGAADPSTAALPQDPEAWEAAAAEVHAELRRLSDDARAEVAAEGRSQSTTALVIVALGTVVALAALIGAALLFRRTWRALAGRLAAIEETAREQADRELPRIRGQLAQAGQERPVVPPAGEYPADEVGRVARAQDEQWRSVVETLIHQDQGRASTETVLLGLARRTQGLINRMIPKLDKLEREHQDSRLLKDIFAVDHLATRVRRHTENLLILGGSLPARRWGKPVPIYEVVRSAISETEDYSRVEALPAPPVSLTGRAVADVSHLLAELIENGTSFSPPETKVSVSAEVVARGRIALEVVDRGLGMSNEEYDRLNALLADPPKLDMMTLGKAPRLGLLVVARLALRHNLEVVLRKSPYGGTLAIVLLPDSLVEEARPLLPDVIGDAPRTSERTRKRAEAAAPQIEQRRPEPVAAPATSLPAAPGPAPDRERPSVAAPAPEAPSVAAAWHGPTDQDALWVSRDGSGYPAYAGAGLLPADDAAQAPPPVPEPPATTAPVRPETRAEDVPEVGYGRREPVLISPMVSGGAGLLPPAGEGPESPAGQQAPATEHTPYEPGYEPGYRQGPWHGQSSAPDDTFSFPAHGYPDAGEAAPDVPPVSVWMPQQTERGTAADNGSQTGERPAHLVATHGTADDGSPLHLPVRVRGESLAEGLRGEQPPLGRDGKGLTDAVRSPEQAGRTIAAIQSGNKRARSAAAHSPGGQGTRAATPGPGTDPEGTARKDQR